MEIYTQLLFLSMEAFNARDHFNDPSIREREMRAADDSAPQKLDGYLIALNRERAYLAFSL